MEDGANGVSGQLAVLPVVGEPNCARVNVITPNLKMAGSTAPEAILKLCSVTQFLVVVCTLVN